MERRITWALLVAALAAFIIFDFASTLATCHQIEHQENGKRAEEGCGFAQSLTYAGAEVAFEWIDRRHDFVTAAATLVIAFFTFTLWRATNKLWDAGERQLAHLNETAERQLRAYVNVMKITVETSGNEHTFSIEIKNFGQTPAYNELVETAVAFAYFPLVHELTLDKSKVTGPSVLAPGAMHHVKIETNSPFSAEELVQVRQGTGAIYIFGRIEYNDAFANFRQTTFRHMIGGDAIISPSGNCAIAREGNEAT
jgi:archaellum component FlaG (FlaF/FlaG flagellin family)